MKSSRRQFIQSTLAAPLMARFVVGPSGAARVETLLAAPAQMEFENPQIIKYDSSCFTLYRKDTMIFSGAFHYPRCPKPLWRDRLAKFKAAGFNTIETYVFWNYHEPEKGKCNLTDFEDFVKLVHEMGFYMIARPGPYVCAEWERGGFPDWVAAMRFPAAQQSPGEHQDLAALVRPGFADDSAPPGQRGRPHHHGAGGERIRLSALPCPTPTSANTFAPSPTWSGAPASACR